MKRNCLRISFMLLAITLILLFTGCGVEYVGYPDEEEGKRQIEIDRPDATPCLEAYLYEKYGLSEADYAISNLTPWTRESVVNMDTTGSSGPYYEGLWQAKVDVSEESFFASIAVSGAKMSHDSRQADEYYSDLEEWFRRKADLPDSCELIVQVDTDYIGKITPANGLVSLIGNNKHYPALAGYYDASNIFSPIEKALWVQIDYRPSNTLSTDYVKRDIVAQLFREDVTGDITVSVFLRTPEGEELLWHRPSSTDSVTASECGVGQI